LDVIPHEHLLSTPDVNLQWSGSQYKQDFSMLYAQELPYFEDRGMCGNCGLTGDLSDVDWFDFLSYVQYKAILRQFAPPTR
jgi:hypothetical protein